MGFVLLESSLRTRLAMAPPNGKTFSSSLSFERTRAGCPWKSPSARWSGGAATRVPARDRTRVQMSVRVRGMMHRLYAADQNGRVAFSLIEFPEFSSWMWSCPFVHSISLTAVKPSGTRVQNIKKFDSIVDRAGSQR